MYKERNKAKNRLRFVPFYVTVSNKPPALKTAGGRISIFILSDHP